jgi:beta-lactamase regulating signal transducer with metallopeptidase domain
MLTGILEAAFRSLLMAVAVWAGIRMMRVQAVLAQKVAWVLVLLAAGTMPLVMHIPWLALDRTGIQALRIPIRSLTGSASHSNPAPPATSKLSTPESIAPQRLSPIPKPSPQHRATHSDGRSSLAFLPAGHLAPAPKLLPELGSQSTPVPAPARTLPTSGMPANFTNAGESNWSQIKQMLVLLYLAVGAILLLRTLTGLGIAYRIWRSSEPVSDLPDETLSIRGKLTVPVRRIRSSRRLTTPVTIGSTVILPANYRQWDEAKLRIVLAHEQSHVLQGDFYLQLLAAIHVAVFWFSPLGWWLQRKLSELGEALSDRAGLEQAQNPTSYAQVLLEFAAMPRTTPLAGVAMARNSNLSSRLERILNARRFHLAFLGGRRHAFLAAVIVPAALVAAIAGVRIVPAVEAAQGQSTAPISGQVSGQVSGVVAPAQVSGQLSGQVSGQVTGQVSGEVTGEVSGGEISGQVSAEASDQVTSVDAVQAPPPSPALAPVAPEPPSPNVEAPPTPEVVVNPDIRIEVAPEPPSSPRAPRHGFAYAFSDGDNDQDSFAIVRGDDNNTIHMSGHSGRELEKIKQKVHGNFIWFERDGKSYVITDPAILAQSESFFRGNDELNRQMALLDQKQAALNEKMKLLEPEMAKASLPGPEFEAQMKKLQTQLAELQSDKYKKLIDPANKEFSEEKLGELQEKMGEIQGQIGEIQGKIGERQGRIGEKQGELGEQMGRLGEEMGRIGEQQGRIAEEASRKMKSVFDRAIRDGKAKPVD